MQDITTLINSLSNGQKRALALKYEKGVREFINMNSDDKLRKPTDFESKLGYKLVSIESKWNFLSLVCGGLDTIQLDLPNCRTSKCDGVFINGAQKGKKIEIKASSKPVKVGDTYMWGELEKISTKDDMDKLKKIPEYKLVWNKSIRMLTDKMIEEEFYKLIEPTETYILEVLTGDLFKCSIEIMPILHTVNPKEGSLQRIKVRYKILSKEFLLNMKDEITEIQKEFLSEKNISLNTIFDKIESPVKLKTLKVRTCNRSSFYNEILSIIEQNSHIKNMNELLLECKIINTGSASPEKEIIVNGSSYFLRTKDAKDARDKKMSKLYQMM